MKNKEKLIKSRNALNIEVKVLIVIYVFFIIRHFIIDIFKNIAVYDAVGSLIILGLLFMLTRLIVILQLRYVCEPLGKSRNYIRWSQTIALIIPLVDIVLPLIILNESGKYLQGEN